MKDSTREPIVGSILLSAHKDGSHPELFEIRSVVGQGSSTICYEAVRVRENGSREIGKLKEFYPIESSDSSMPWYFSLKRQEDNQLIPGTGTVRKFGEMCERYLSSYTLLQEVVSQQKDNEILNNFIQHFEIFYGSTVYEQDGADNENTIRDNISDIIRKATGKKGTVYIWSPGVAGIGFDTYLQQVREHPDRDPEKTLEDIISVIKALADAVKAMHMCGILHGDIKPSNFLVTYDSSKNINTSSISLFDINTIRKAGDPAATEVGTYGFCDPEVLKGRRPDNRSDIYAIGAMLFNALIIVRGLPDDLYHSYYYNDFAKLIKDSSLFKNSPRNQNSSLMAKICNVLSKCLADNPRLRYQSCSELIGDLDKVLEKINALKFGYVASARNPKANYTDPVIAIQKLLYEHPLFNEAITQKQDLNILVLGSGDYGQKFIDIAMQVGQMQDVTLCIDAYSDDPDSDKDTYLRFRPAMSDFIMIDGEWTPKKYEPYAALNFKAIRIDGEHGSFYKNNVSANKAILESICTEKEYHYVFVALGTEQITHDIAHQCARNILDLTGEPATVAYISATRKYPDRNENTTAYPVYIGEEMGTEDILENLEQMAVNTDSVWFGEANIDVPTRLSEFRKDTYRFSSSLAFVLSIKYKLLSVGIDSDDPEESAGRFDEEILSSDTEEAREKFRKMAYLEHRRWVLDRLSDGWKAPWNEKGEFALKPFIALGRSRDNVNRIHPCIVYGTEDNPLDSEEYQKNHREKWDIGEIDPALDDLDRMSLELHRTYGEYKEQLKQNNFLNTGVMADIQAMIPAEAEEAVSAFRRFQFAVKNILNGVESYSRQYNSYKNALEAALNSLDDSKSTLISTRLNAISRDLFAVREFNLYRNYKAQDDELLRKIPYILTYRFTTSIATAFEDGKLQNERNEAVFTNVAAASTLCPSKIVYLYCFDKDSDISIFFRKADAVMNYLGSRQSRCAVTFVVSCLDEVKKKTVDSIQKRLGSMKSKYSDQGKTAWIEDYELLASEDYDSASTEFINYLKRNPVDIYDGSTPMFTSIYENSSFIGKLRALGLPYFEFDWRHKEFTKRIKCDYLQYKKDNAFIRINDMFALMNATDNKFNLPEFADDYEALWGIYTGNYIKDADANNRYEKGVSIWNNLCTFLDRHERNRPFLSKINKLKAEDPVGTELTLFLPEFAYTTTNKILEKLIGFGIADERSRVTSYASDTCLLEITTHNKYLEEIKKIFADPSKLLPYYGVDVERLFTGQIVVKTNQMEAVSVNIDPDGEKKANDGYALLQELQNKHFITGLSRDTEHPEKVSFIYSSPRIKKLLTSAGEILEVYAYYEVLKKGYFDDIASGYEFKWASGEVQNELDLVLTKGFRSMIIECKAVLELDLNYYHKLHSIADQFGIGTIKVLLENQYRLNNQAANAKNAMQEDRGRQLHINTISKRKDVLNIGETLVKLMQVNS